MQQQGRNEQAAWLKGWLPLLAFMLSLGSMKACAHSDSLPWQPAELVHSLQLDLSSEHTGRQYRIFVSVPTTPPPASGYPVIHVLDGNALFAPLALQARSTDLRAARERTEPALIVGIGYPLDALYDMQARAEDYTPAATDLKRPRSSNAAQFRQFIEDELKPLLAAQFPIDPQRQTLFGHSFGGLFVLDTLFNAPGSYQTYIAASPSLWWAQQSMEQGRKRLQQLLPRHPMPLRLLLSVGTAEEPGPDDTSERARLLHERRMLTNVLALQQALQPLHCHGLHVERYIIPDADHGQSARLTSLQVLDFASDSGAPAP